MIQLFDKLFVKKNFFLDGFWRNESSEFDYYIPNRYSVPFSKTVPLIIRYPTNVLENQNISVYAIDNLNNSEFRSRRFSLAIQKLTNEGVGLSALNPTYSYANYSSESSYLPKNFLNFSNILHLELLNGFNTYPGSFKVIYEVSYYSNSVVIYNRVFSRFVK